MHLQRAETRDQARAEFAGSADTITVLHGHWLAAARLLWCLVVSLVVAVVAGSIPSYFAYLHILVANPNPRSQQLTTSGVDLLAQLHLTVDAYAILNIVSNMLFVLGFLAIGGLLFWQKAEDRMALLTAFALVAFPVGFISVQTTTLAPEWAPLVEITTFLAGTGLSVFFYLFPDGRFIPRWTRWLILGWVIYEAAERFFPTSPYNPLARMPGINNAFFIGLLTSILGVQIYRYRRVSTVVQRRQTRWVVFGCSIGILGLIVVVLLSVIYPTFFQPGSLAYFVANTVLLLSMLCIPVSIAIAILRSHLWDIDLIINRTLVYTLLTTGVVGIYIFITLGVGRLFQVQGNLVLSLLATALIAVLFQPVRLRLQRGVNRAMYGERDDPYAVLAGLASRLEATLTPEKVLLTIVQTVAQALKLPYVGLAVLPEQTLPGSAEVGSGEPDSMPALRAPVPDEAQIAAAAGSPTAGVISLPLVYQSTTVGYLLLAPRTGDTFGRSDERLLSDLATQAGVAVYAARLTTHLRDLSANLQRARERLVTTREEERRRLRRDLHDGLGPTLASMSFKVEAAKNLLTSDPERASKLLDSVGQQAQETIADVRRLVYNLRPPALDELGLLAALREQAAHYQHGGLQIDLDLPQSLPPLLAAVEVALYRISQEALSNAARHAGARRCLLQLFVEPGAAHLEIADDGKGISVGHRTGVGLHSMEERAAELGGTCSVGIGPSGGTIVSVRLPLAGEE